MKHKPRHLAEYGFLRVLGGLLCLLPHRGALALAWGLARLSSWIAPGRVREARRRLRCVFGDQYSEREIRRIAWVSLRNFTFSAVEMIRLPTMRPHSVDRICRMDQVDKRLLEQAAAKQGALIALPHMGSWELAALAMHFRGCPVFSIAAPQRNPLTNDYLHHLRTVHGIETVTRGDGTLRQVVKRLRQGGMLGILPDVRMRQADLKLPFLGGEANLGSGMAMFARLTKTPIFPYVIRRQGWTQQVARSFPPIWPDSSASRDDDVRRMTVEVMTIIEAAIRETPEQWFWYNRRWILDPIDAA